MKKLLTILLLLTAFAVQAQTQQQFKYQAVLRDTDGNIISNREITVDIDILQTSVNGESVFTETHTVTTTANGLINLNIGSINNLDNVNWESDKHYIQIALNGSVMGTSQLLSVPYALHSKTAESISGNINESDPVFGASAANNISNSGSGHVITSAERTKLTNIEDGANVNIQANWNQTNTAADDYIKNKPNSISDFNLDANSQVIENLADPVNAQDAATKAYVDANSGGGSGVIDGTNPGDLLYWSGTQWTIVPAGNNGELLTFSNGQPQWASNSPGSATVETNSVSDTTCHTATISSEVVSEGGNAVTERGIVWGTTPNLNVNDDEKITRGIGSGTYDATIIGLNESASYYARAYAINSAGVVYGDALEIITPAPTEGATSQLTDIEGNVYNSVYRNGKWWMAEHLKTTKLNDNTEIQFVTNNTEWEGLGTSSTPGYCWYGNNESNHETYGNMYNWYTVQTGKVCPDGWHVPSKNEWTALEEFLYTNGFNYDGSTYENKIAKALAAEAENWEQASYTMGSPGYDAYPEYQNKTGFNMLPGGERNYNGSFSERRASVGLWSRTTSATDTDKAWYIFLWFNYIDSSQSTWFKTSGHYIRCVKDN